MGDCDKCKLRPGTEIWVGDGGVLAFTHGMSQRWCMQCVVEEQLNHARARAAAIPELEQRLADLKAQS